MRYPYQHVRRGDAIRYLPLLPVTIQGEDGSLEALTLIDSGAEDNIFQMDVAEQLGLDVTDGYEVTTFGYDGREAKAYRTMVGLELDKEVWEAPVIFSDALAGRDLLGQLGFFAFSDVTFKYSDRVMDVRRVK